MIIKYSPIDTLQTSLNSVLQGQEVFKDFTLRELRCRLAAVEKKKAEHKRNDNVPNVETILQTLASEEGVLKSIISNLEEEISNLRGTESKQIQVGNNNDRPGAAEHYSN